MLILPDDVRRDRLISPEYLKQQQEMHARYEYGVASKHYAPIVAKVMNQYGVTELLDYGCGRGALAQTLMAKKMVEHAFRVQHYEPSMPHWAAAPEPTEMVACIDVLEHIEPDLIDNVLDDLRRCTKSIGAFTVSTEPAMKTLDDGRNAHLIIQPSAWWLPKIQQRFDLQVFQRLPDGFLVLVQAFTTEQH